MTIKTIYLYSFEQEGVWDFKPGYPAPRLEDAMSKLSVIDPVERARFVNPTTEAMQGSMILAIAGDVRARIARGETICNLTVGDFDPMQFPIPTFLRNKSIEAMDAGHTAYPPPEGILDLRKSIASWYGRSLGIEVDPSWVIVASGARPVMYSTARMFLQPGDGMAFCLPSWNNGYYAQLNEAIPLPIATKPENNFFPTAEELEPVLPKARLFTLNSPLNPTGTVISREQLGVIAELVLAENRRRSASGRPPLMWMWDQVYWQLCYGVAHVHPAALVPEVAPFVVTVDATSKMWAATGLRVGWAVLPPILAERMGALVGHMGAWAPRPYQAATAALLDNEAEQAAFMGTFRAGLQARLQALSAGLSRLGVSHLVPQGAMYLSVRFSLFGKPGIDGHPMKTNEDIRKFLLVKAGVAVVPFQAFDLAEDSGWFRMSVGAVSLASLEAAISRLETALSGISG